MKLLNLRIRSDRGNSKTLRSKHHQLKQSGIIICCLKREKKISNFFSSTKNKNIFHSTHCQSSRSKSLFVLIIRTKLSNTGRNELIWFGWNYSDRTRIKQCRRAKRIELFSNLIEFKIDDYFSFVRFQSEPKMMMMMKMMRMRMMILNHRLPVTKPDFLSPSLIYCH